MWQLSVGLKFKVALKIPTNQWCLNIFYPLFSETIYYFMDLKVHFIHQFKTVACIVLFDKGQSLLQRNVFESLDFSEPISKF